MKKEDVIAKIFCNPIVIMFFIGCLLFLVIGTIVSQVWNPFAPSGTIVGNFRKAEHRGLGDFCGQYPFTRIVIDNYSIIGDIDGGDNEFYFDNQYSKVDKLSEGQIIKISYHQESRPSDTTSGDTIYYWVIDNIEVLN